MNNNINNKLTDEYNEQMNKERMDYQINDDYETTYEKELFKGDSSKINDDTCPFESSDKSETNNTWNNEDENPFDEK